MRINQHKDGEEEIHCGFLLWPKTLPDHTGRSVTRWLEWAIWKVRYSRTWGDKKAASGSGTWICPVHFQLAPKIVEAAEAIFDEIKAEKTKSSRMTFFTDQLGCLVNQYKKKQEL